MEIIAFDQKQIPDTAASLITVAYDPALQPFEPNEGGGIIDFLLRLLRFLKK